MNAKKNVSRLAAASCMAAVLNHRWTRRRILPRRTCVTASEIDDVVAFLCTLTDGYDPGNPAGYIVPTQCQPTADAPAAAFNQGTEP